MKKISLFQKMMLLVLCALIIGFISNLLYRGNELLIFSKISNICYALAFIIQIVSLFVSKQDKETSSVNTTKNKILISLAILLTLILIVVIIILITKTLNL